MSQSRIVIWTVWMVASLFYAYQYLLRVMPNIMLNDIMRQFHIDAATFGQFSGIYYIGYSLMHLPIGIMLDRYGPRKVMTGCIGLTVLGLLPLLFAHYWAYPIVGRALIGMGSSAAILGIFKIVRMLFEEKYFTRMISFSVMVGLIGAIYGGSPVSYMCTILGYQEVIKIFVVIGLILASVTYFILPEMETVTSNTSIKVDIKEVLSNKKVWLICILAGFMVGPLEGFADVWGTEFLKQVYGLQSTVAAGLTSLIFIGMCFGAPILSFIAEKTGYYWGTIAGAAYLMTASFIVLMIGYLSIHTISIAFILVGICCAYQILAIYKASTCVKAQIAGLTTAMANMIIMIFGYGFHTLIGSIIDSLGGPGMAKAFNYGIAVIPIGLSIGAIGFSIFFLLEKMQCAVKA